MARNPSRSRSALASTRRRQTRDRKYECVGAALDVLRNELWAALKMGPVTLRETDATIPEVFEELGQLLLERVGKVRAILKAKADSFTRR
mgnify:CR=1 FL=1